MVTMEHKADSDISGTKRDWRLRGQERYLLGAQLAFNKYESSPGWNHDHCAFCFARFGDSEGDLHHGYCTPDRYYWICENCFEDFEDMFKWRHQQSL
jgi:hypothetical protein